MHQARDGLYRKLRSTLLRWELAAIVIVMGVISLVAILTSGAEISDVGRWAVYGSLGLLSSVLVMSWVVRWRKLKYRLAATEQDLDTTRAQMTAAFRLSHQFARAQDEQAIIEQVLDNCLHVVGVKGASFVSLETTTRAQPAYVQGDLPPQMMRDWAEFVGATHTRSACAACQSHSTEGSHACPLMGNPLENVSGIHCFPVRRDDTEIGVLNLYLPADGGLNPEALAFLSAMLDEMAMAIEAVRLRTREEAASLETQVSARQDPETIFRAQIQGLAEVLDADWAYLCLYEDQACSRPYSVSAGRLPDIGRQMLHELARSIGDRENPEMRIASDPGVSLPEGVAAALISPLRLPDGDVLGGLVLGWAARGPLNGQACTIARAVSTLLAVTIHFSRLLQEVEYHAVISERTRLAREIHDGLAQTLGFLKLHAAQMQGFLERGDSDRLAGAVELYRSTLADAYQDARQAIDGLRITPAGGLDTWLVHAAEEFAENYGLDLVIDTTEAPPHLPFEVQAQLVRIVQEALTNVRKHAGASRVAIGWRLVNEELVLEIEDDGHGFVPHDVLGPARHGLTGMQERAEIISADLEIVSGSGQGTIVRLRLPLRAGEVMV